jgi:hypothetical protein
MLIMRVFPVFSLQIYSGQHRYYENVINFLQNVVRSSFLSFLISIIIKYTRVLKWLIENNYYYFDVIINKEVLESLLNN